MTLTELLILAISLCFDTFAVSLGGGMSLKNNSISKKASIMAFFGFFQAALLFLGWGTGALFAPYIVEWDHWVAFGILAYIGGKMIFENLHPNDSQNSSHSINMESFKTLAILAVATSIDAIAVGVSLAMMEIVFSRILLVTLFTFIFTALASFVGLEGGKTLGTRVGSRASLLGGIILLIIGIKILFEHLFL